MSVPSWLVEGIADYIRYQYGINNVNAGWVLPMEVGNDQNYTDSYRVTAAFLKWIEENVHEGTVKEISSLITKGEYKESDWERITGASLNKLWEIYTDPEGKVVVYIDSDYKGKSAILFTGKHDMKELTEAGIPNDSISSIKVPDGYEVIAYGDINFSGNSVAYKSGVTYVGDEWNDLITSVEVTCPDH